MNSPKVSRRIWRKVSLHQNVHSQCTSGSLYSVLAQFHCAAWRHSPCSTLCQIGTALQNWQAVTICDDLFQEGIKWVSEFGCYPGRNTLYKLSCACDWNVSAFDSNFSQSPSSRLRPSKRQVFSQKLRENKQTWISQQKYGEEYEEKFPCIRISTV